MPNRTEHPLPHPPAGGRGAVKGAISAFSQQGLLHQLPGSFLTANKPGGFDCPGCAFPDTPGSRGPDSCEQGQKAIAWEMTRRAADSTWIAGRTLDQLRTLSDHELEASGRLTEPLRFDAARNTYVAIAWDEALRLAGSALQAADAQKAVFYASGRSSNEAAFLWQLFARSQGSANLPDSSNFCHEPSGVAMRQAIGIGKGTCGLEDFALADLIIVIGQNPATNHPRMMVALREAALRGAKVVALNPLVERGFVNFSDPKDLGEMISNRGVAVAHRVLQVKVGGDLAALKGVMKAVLALHESALAQQKPPVLDVAFIAQHTQGFDALVADLNATAWPDIERHSGLARTQIEELAELYAQSPATMATWCMGVTQHEHGGATVQTILNLLLLKGNIGKPGSGAMPVRGHSNVQGDRTMGATHKVSEAWLTNIEAEFPGSQLNRSEGWDAVAAIGALSRGEVSAFLSLGGNFGVAAPDSPQVLAGLLRCDLTVHIATKLNRTHLYPGRVGLILPSLGRTDADGTGHSEADRFVTVEDSSGTVKATRGRNRALSPHMRSEPWIVAQLARAAQPASAIPWVELGNNHAATRQRIEACQQGVVPGFEGFNARAAQPGGFRLPNSAAQRVWKTASGRAEFRVWPLPEQGPVQRAKTRVDDPERVLALMTIRSHDQFNTTVYGQDDRYRGVFGNRRVVFMHPADLARAGLADGSQVSIETCSQDGVQRRVQGFTAKAYNIPEGCAAAYFPEATPLIPSGLFDQLARTPAYKEVPVRVTADVTT